MIRFDRLQGHFLKSDKFLGCFLVLRKPLLVSFCVVVWVLFSVFCFTSFGDHTIRNSKKLPIFCSFHLQPVERLVTCRVGLFVV